MLIKKVNHEHKGVITARNAITFGISAEISQIKQRGAILNRLVVDANFKSPFSSVYGFVYVCFSEKKVLSVNLTGYCRLSAHKVCMSDIYRFQR